MVAGRAPVLPRLLKGGVARKHAALGLAPVVHAFALSAAFVLHIIIIIIVVVVVVIIARIIIVIIIIIYVVVGLNASGARKADTDEHVEPPPLPETDHSKRGRLVYLNEGIEHENS